MFDALKLRIFVSRVQAELIAQHKDQQFVNAVCQVDETLEGLNEIRKNAYYRKDKIAPFLSVCYVLGEGLEAGSLSTKTREVCADLLFDRLCKARSDPYFHMRHFQIFGDLESKLSAWRENEHA